MRIQRNILALCVFQAIGATAFVVQTPKARLSSELNASVDRRTKTNPMFSWGSTDSSTKAPSSGSQQKQNEEAMSNAITVQGGSLRTFSITSPFVESVRVTLTTEGRPMEANIDLWQGPDNSPLRMAVYVENGATHPFTAIVPTPNGSNSVAIRNVGQLEFPMEASLSVDPNDAELVSYAQRGYSKVVQGGAVSTYPFEPRVASVLVLCETDGRPLNARIELLQGPNNDKQVIEMYSEDGLNRPFFAIVETPGFGNVVRVVNTATMEYPMRCSIVPYEELNPNDDPFTVM